MTEREHEAMEMGNIPLVKHEKLLRKLFQQFVQQTKDLLELGMPELELRTENMLMTDEGDAMIFCPFVLKPFWHKGQECF